MLKSSKKYSLNRMNASAIKNLLGMELHHTKNSQIGIYDFSSQGGAISTINLKNAEQDSNLTLPKGAIITNVLIYVQAAATSGGSATIAFGAASTVDLKAATAVASYSLAAFLAGIPVGTAATAIAPLAADTIPTVTIATAALTAGKIYVYIDYNLSSFVD